MSLTFLPWLRTGIAGAQTVPDGDPAARNRGTVQISLALNDTGIDTPTPQVLGPGDVVGITASQVLRTDPPDATSAHEPSRFVSIDLRDPALPWQFTPTAAPASERLRPWITLVVVREQPGVAIEAPAAAGCARLRIGEPAKPDVELPDLSTAWAWAHVQLTGHVDAAGLANLLEQAPERARSRLLCTRPLAAGEHYLACVVPTFAAGREAALGTVPQPDAQLTPAWSAGATEVVLPVYHSWRFGTAEAGDFLSLAALLRGRRAPGAGTRSIDVSQAGLDDVPDSLLVMPGALRDPDFDPDGARPSDALRSALSAATADAGDAELVAPIYGEAYAEIPTVAPDSDGWLAQLNLDPRRRIAAALGGAVVRAGQEDLVAAVWQQIGDTTLANGLVDRAALARGVAARLRVRHLTPLDPAVLVQVTSPAHSRLRMSPATLRASLDAGAIPSGATWAAFRRLTRPPAVR